MPGRWICGVLPRRRLSDLEVGNRIDGDNALYPDDDLMWCEDEAGVFAAHKDGRRY